MEFRQLLANYLNKIIDIFVVNFPSRKMDFSHDFDI